MNTSTKTFQTLDYKLFDQYMQDAKFLNLKLVTFRVKNEKELDLTLSGNSEMLKTFTSWINNRSNWTKEALEVSDYGFMDVGGMTYDEVRFSSRGE